MKHQQVVVDYWSMLKTSSICLLLAISGYVLLKMIQTIFWLPGHLKKNQKRLEELEMHFSHELSQLEESQTEADDEGASLKANVDETVEEKKDI